MAKIITCTIEDDASVTAEAEGFQGKGCEKALADLLSTLGGKTTSANKKPEYYKHEGTKIKVGG